MRTDRRALLLLPGLASLLAAGCVFAPPAYEPAPAQRPAAEPVVADPEVPRMTVLETRHVVLSEPDQALIGEIQAMFTRDENTFVEIAREYNIGYQELRYANPDVDHWLPGEGTRVYLPTQRLLPDAPREGIVLNLPSMRLFYFAPAGDGDEAIRVSTHPIGIGRQGWETPVGEATVTQKARDPIWYVPLSVREEHAAAGDPLPSTVPPGSDNPLGRFALALSMPGYLIHGTNKPAGVGMRVSHGCVRLYPEDIELLFERVTVGTPVTIVNQPVLAGWHEGQLYLQVHPPLAEDQRDLAAAAEAALAAALAAAGDDEAQLDEQAVAAVVEQRLGIPFPVLSSTPPISQYLADARIVENTIPPPQAETTAQAE